ncbi:MAG: DUF4838 domain-containing protein [Planctomycetes bacterium]|nr:DUF4838 domain-containing protein [Planctomycetota bacterium]
MRSFPSRRQFLHQAGTVAVIPTIGISTDTQAHGADEAAVSVELVKAGKPVATIVSAAKAIVPKKGATKLPAGGEAFATQLLVDWVKKITGAELPVSDKPPAEGAAIYVGKAATQAGLKLDDIESPSKEGIRIIAGNGRVLIGGQSDEATTKAVCRFLEELGCRYFMDGPLGEVFPKSADLSVKPTSITEKPGLLYRNPKGPTWSAGPWKTWNGAGGEDFAHSHSWGRYIPKGTFAEHPEYFAQGADGKRKDGDWLCTSNAGAREMFANNVIGVIKGGAKNPSISPPDGRGYCRCDKCVAQDDPKAIEPSSGTISISTRYADFFDDVAQRVAKVYPDSVLNFYVYADYTQPPVREKKLAPNLCAVIAPIRYCRLHAIGNADCPSRKQQLDMVDGWSKVATRLGYYNYMYNLADATLPMFKFTPCKVEFPYLAGKGLAFMTIEVLSNWYLYGPQIYLSLRMAYNPKLDATALMEDYYEKFYGPAAASMKTYWTAIDETTAKLHNHSGGFYGLASAYSPELLRTCETALAKAALAAKEDATYSERVAMHTAGFQNILDYRGICDSMAKGDFANAKELFTTMTKRIEGLIAKKQANPEYGTSYLRRFMLKTLDGGASATAAPNKLLAVLPDKWKFAPDDADEGEAKTFFAVNHDDAKWRQVATHSATLSGQGIGENTVLWYRSKFTLPAKKPDAVSLVFTEVDGDVSVYVNGKKREPKPVLTAPVPKKANPNAPAVPRRSVFAVDVGEVGVEGENVVAVRVDNRKISELFLGGILRPVLLVEKGTK